MSASKEINEHKLWLLHCSNPRKLHIRPSSILLQPIIQEKSVKDEAEGGVQTVQENRVHRIKIY